MKVINQSVVSKLVASKSVVKNNEMLESILKAFSLSMAAVMSLLMSAGIAKAQISHNGELNSVQSNLPRIANFVRNCVVQPYSIKADGNKAFGLLKSHCVAVTVIHEKLAQVLYYRHLYQIQILESADSDADFYDVQVTDLVTNEKASMTEVLAYGDVLLGVLGGDTHDVPAVLMGGDQPIILPAQRN